jgi:hypothetical protein
MLRLGTGHSASFWKSQDSGTHQSQTVLLLPTSHFYQLLLLSSSPSLPGKHGLLELDL